VERIPFRVYDFFAYLSSGAVLVSAWDWLYGPHFVLQEKLPAHILALALLLSYVVGHAASNVSAFLFESLIVRKLLGPPSRVLMGAAAPPGVRWIFAGYYRPLDLETRERIERRATAAGIERAEGEALFQLAFARLARDAGVLSRLDEFRDNYGFARISALAVLLVAAAMSITRWTGKAHLPISWIATCAVLGIVLFYRYLKFFRQYTYHLLVLFSAEGGDDRK
jgi:hypothetical protein